MNEIFTNVDWLAVAVGAVAAFALGAFWYGQSMFGKNWMKGLGTQHTPGRSLPMLLAVQAIVTFLFAWLLALLAGHSLELAILGAIVVAGIIKVNGLFSGHSKYTVAVDAGYILAEAAIVLIVLRLFN